MDLHIFFLPFLSQGHMIPMVDMAKLFASRGVKATIVITTGNAPLIQPSLHCSPHSIRLLTLPFLPSVSENFTTPELIEGLNTLKEPFERLLIDHRPDCIVSDVMYPWSAGLAVEHKITRIVFSGSSIFSRVISGAISRFKPHESTTDEDEPFVVPGVPHRIELLRSQLMDSSVVLDMVTRIVEARKDTYGTITNTFRYMEPGYADGLMDGNSWLIGPLSLCNTGLLDRASRGGQEFDDQLLRWLDSKEPGSILYVCFGSLGQFTRPQLSEIARGLNSCVHPFIWVVRNADETSEWMPKGMDKKGLIVRGWAPQIVILNHGAVGGFLTHCGWNSCLEGASAGLPMITWPLVSDQFLNERLLVDVLRIGVPVGSKVCTHSEEKRSWISGEKVEEVAEEVMGSGEQAEERRKRAKEVAVMARMAVEEGGPSYNELSNLIQELKEVKAGQF